MGCSGFSLPTAPPEMTLSVNHTRYISGESLLLLPYCSKQTHVYGWLHIMENLKRQTKLRSIIKGYPVSTERLEYLDI